MSKINILGALAGWWLWCSLPVQLHANSFTLLLVVQPGKCHKHGTCSGNQKCGMCQRRGKLSPLFTCAVTALSVLSVTEVNQGWPVILRRHALLVSELPHSLISHIGKLGNTAALNKVTLTGGLTKSTRGVGVHHAGRHQQASPFEISSQANK